MIYALYLNFDVIACDANIIADDIVGGRIESDLTGLDVEVSAVPGTFNLVS